MREVVIASSVRTAVGKAPKGALRITRPDDLAAIAIKGALDRVPQVDKREIEDRCGAAEEGRLADPVRSVGQVVLGLPRCRHRPARFKSSITFSATPSSACS